MTYRTNRYVYICLTVVVLLFAVTGCGRSVSKDEVLATIGDMKITVGQFNERISNLPVRYQAIVKKRKEEFLQEVISDLLLYQEALRKDLDKNKEVLSVIAEARKKILTARLLKDEVDDAIAVSEENVRDFYVKNSDKYMTPEIMRVSHILVLSEDEADMIVEELASGAKFEDIARAKSVDPTAQRGGDIGYFPKGQLMPEFENGCATLDVGEISDVVKTKLGYHIIKLTDRRAPELRPLKQVRDKIKVSLRTAKRRIMFNAMLKKLREETMIEINKKALDSVGKIEKDKDK